VKSWAFRDRRDLRLMQDLTSRLWSTTSFHHVGGLAWQLRGSYTTSLQPRLWGTDERIAAWAFIGDGHASVQVDPAAPKLAREVVRWAADAGATQIDAPDGEHVLIDALTESGFVLDPDAPFSVDMRRGIDDVRAVEIPAGYSVRSVTADDLDERVAVHRAAWAPSRFTRESYDDVRTNPPYREALDIVAVAPDGTFAACCIAWLDDATSSAEIEPVGTHPDHRRRNLASAICLEAVRRVGALGGDELTIHPRGDDAYPVPRIVYGNIGFRTINALRSYVRRA
jgi:ribosomal protein S18 acetylase RimI-like enzyme